VFVKAKEAGADAPLTVAFTVYDPAVALAVKAGEVATPEAFVFTVAVVPPPAKVPLAPEAGALNVTLAAETKLPPASFTVATSGLLKAVLIRALWPLPDVAVMVPGVPAVFVNAKEAGPLAPVTVALTV
jgi:hypothetical protein